MLSIFNDELIARAISAAASERRWRDIETIIEQYGRLHAASEELVPLVQDYVDVRVRREMGELREVDVLYERWLALKPNVTTEGDLPDAVVEDAYRLARDGRHVLRMLETDAAIARMDALDQEMKDRNLPGVRPDANPELKSED
jgi:hypothetical protein